MKSVIFSTAFALLAAVAKTAPAPAQALEARQFYVAVTFFGVGPDDYYTQSFPANGQPVPICTYREQPQELLFAESSHSNNLQLADAFFCRQ